MEKLLFRYFLALVLLYGLIAIVLGQGKPKPTCGPACWGQPCTVSKNDCKMPCVCVKTLAPGDHGICLSDTCLNESCTCLTEPIPDAPFRPCCAGLRCLESKKPRVFGEGICRK